MKAEILENLEKRISVPVQPTGVNLPKDSIYPLSNAIEHQKAHNFLEALVALAHAPAYIHRLLLMLHLNPEFYNELKQKEQPINRAKPYEFRLRLLILLLELKQMIVAANASSLYKIPLKIS
jgi:hypothetical protein